MINILTTIKNFLSSSILKLRNDLPLLKITLELNSNIGKNKEAKHSNLIKGIIGSHFSVSNIKTICSESAATKINNGKLINKETLYIFKK